MLHLTLTLTLTLFHRSIENFSAYNILHAALFSAASPAERLRSAGSLATSDEIKAEFSFASFAFFFSKALRDTSYGAYSLGICDTKALSPLSRKRELLSAEICTLTFISRYLHLGPYNNIINPELSLFSLFSRNVLILARHTKLKLTHWIKPYFKPMCLL